MVAIRDDIPLRLEQRTGTSLALPNVTKFYYAFQTLRLFLAHLTAIQEESRKQFRSSNVCLHSGVAYEITTVGCLGNLDESDSRESIVGYTFDRL